MILLDTNIFLRWANNKDPLHGVAEAALDSLEAGGEAQVFVPQTVYEFWATATRPVPANGLGWSAVETADEVRRMKSLYTLLADAAGLFDEWERLVTLHACRGRVSFDTRLVAAMGTHGISKILTFNTADFQRYPGLTVIDPRSFTTAAFGS